MGQMLHGVIYMTWKKCPTLGDARRREACGERGTRAQGVGALNLDLAKKWRKLVITPVL